MVVFAITGTLSRPRAQVVADINRAGHTVATSLTKAVQYLVQGASNRANDSIKATKAANAGIKVINESQLMRMLNGGGGGGSATASPSKKRVTPARAPRAKKAATASPATRAQQQRRVGSQMASQSYASPSNRRSADFAKQMSASRSAAAEQQKQYRPADSPSSTIRYRTKPNEWYKRPHDEGYIRRYISGTPIQEGSALIRQAAATLSSLMQNQFNAIKPIYSHLSQAMQQLGSALREVGDRVPIGRVDAKQLNPVTMIQNIAALVRSGKSLYNKEAQNLRNGVRTAKSLRNELTQISAAVRKLTNAYYYHLLRAQEQLAEKMTSKARPPLNSERLSRKSTPSNPVQPPISPPTPPYIASPAHRDSRRAYAQDEVVEM